MQLSQGPQRAYISKWVLNFMIFYVRVTIRAFHPIILHHVQIEWWIFYWFSQSITLFSLQSDMKLIGVDSEALKQHFGKKIVELEEEKTKIQVGMNLFNFKYLWSVALEVYFYPSDGFWTNNDRKRGTYYCMRWRIVLLIQMGYHTKSKMFVAKSIGNRGDFFSCLNVNLEL